MPQIDTPAGLPPRNASSSVGPQSACRPRHRSRYPGIARLLAARRGDRKRIEAVSNPAPAEFSQGLELDPEYVLAIAARGETRRVPDGTFREHGAGLTVRAMRVLMA